MGWLKKHLLFWKKEPVPEQYKKIDTITQLRVARKEFNNALNNLTERQRQKREADGR